MVKPHRDAGTAKMACEQLDIWSIFSCVADENGTAHRDAGTAVSASAAVAVLGAADRPICVAYAGSGAAAAEDEVVVHGLTLLEGRGTDAHVSGDAAKEVGRIAV